MQKSLAKRQKKIKALVEELLLKGGLIPTEEISRGLMAYLEELYSWNQHVNLTGLKTLEDMALKHIGDTLVLVQHLPGGAYYLLDIGTGAGSPGLVLKLLRRDLEIVLVDAVRKKVSFLNTVIAETGLTGIWAEHGRIGSYIPRHLPPGGFDIAVSQALGPMAELIDMAGPLISSNGMIIAMKGPHIDMKLGKGDLIGWRYNIIRTQVPVSGHRRSLIVIQRDRS